jgi:ribosomal protein S18 acetylase RimI-like enzyme
MSVHPLSEVTVSICNGGDDPTELAEFFCDNLTDSYISHSELQSERTTPDGQWAPDIRSIITQEFRDALAQPESARLSAPSWNGIFVARLGRSIAGLAVVLYVRDKPANYGVVEDVVVDGTLRGRGIGTKLINFILEDMRSSGLDRAFLESGKANEAAHELFHKVGFETASVVMRLNL